MVQKNGFENFVISVHYLSKKQQNTFRMEKFNINIKYIIENKPYGTAGSLRFLKKNQIQLLFVMEMFYQI